jgi:hypothetical protein
MFEHTYMKAIWPGHRRVPTVISLCQHIQPLPGACMAVTQDSGQSQPMHRSESTEVAIRDPHGTEPTQDVAQWTVVQDGINLSACHRCPERDFSDPLRMASESSAADTRPGADSDAPDESSGSGGLSQLLSNILDQLSISAWLPAAMLVGNVALLLQLHSNRNLNIAGAIKELTGKPLGTLIVLAFSLLLATIITQAFEFESIRFLEGYYNSTNRVIQAGLAFRIRRHEAKRRRLQGRHQQDERDAFMKARHKMLAMDGAYDRAALDIIDDRLHQRAPRKVTPDVERTIAQIDWRAQLPSHTRYKMDCIRARLDSYPVSNRVLPTRLGNVLRASEEKLPLARSENLEGFVIRHHHELPSALRAEHKEFRTRLDMYCCMVLVFITLALLGITLLIDAAPPWGVALFAGAYCAMSYVCYEAAIASARGYGGALLEIGQQIRRRVPGTN